ncbi:hypothetical protein [Actinomadura sp. 6N118]|uniref:hypothetical protein n=1 Tax=Actinomadura sp. 6N118 TaxID=3375151 RepID=UPI00379D3F3C
MTGPHCAASSYQVAGIRARMPAREIDEPHRTASQLELLFDLTFVVAIAAVTA